MITKEEVLLIHTEVVKLHGGANGIREIAGLESAIAKPYQTYDSIHPVLKKQQQLGKV